MPDLLQQQIYNGGSDHFIHQVRDLSEGKRCGQSGQKTCGKADQTSALQVFHLHQRQKHHCQKGIRLHIAQGESRHHHMQEIPHGQEESGGYQFFCVHQKILLCSIIGPV
ncbi:hypothetical protein SDC9_210021 [bioreactor metagenome]|uniref:Uncharacterized protein n=1 Tax=bioreactor metagenome TaxID=1076179 RepID=A0A645JPS8_9ZZZZ